MGKIIKTFVLILLLIIPFSVQAYASDTTKINDLIENALSLDGKNVTIQGEAIGESFERGEYSWVNVNDGTNIIGIWMKTDDAQKITYYGNYKNKGDTLRISGIFRRSCSEHGGELDIHSDTVVITNTGSYVPEHISDIKIIAAVFLSMLSGFVVWLYLKMKK
ncbi:MAG: DNA-binding protein [Eubacteriaceae bacterium]|nr:DNA-binding protein [Eubacteriaceae bacterium]